MARLKRNYNYFDAFRELALSACEAAKMLSKIMRDFDPKTMDKNIKDMHQIEHSADIIHHQMLRHLSKEFITPIEREDIILLGRKLDEVVDCIEDVALRIYMCNVQHMRTHALEMATIVEKCCQALTVCLDEFSNFKKSSTIHNLLIEINRLEEDGDNIYIESNRQLHTSNDDALTIYVWGTILTQLEQCCDACEHVADAIEMVIMKNS